VLSHATAERCSMPMLTSQRIASRCAVVASMSLSSHMVGCQWKKRIGTREFAKSISDRKFAMKSALRAEPLQSVKELPR
jgi:hypothetical protein